MAEKLSLLDFQAQLAERLKERTTLTGEGAKLGFLAGGQHWLTDLDQVSEMVTVPRLTPVAWARPWFIGVANVRGVLYGCSDLAGFLGIDRPPEKGEIRLLLANPRFGVNAALRIDRALGLRSVANMTMQAGHDNDAVSATWHDEDGTDWKELDVEALVSTPEFLRAG